MTTRSAAWRERALLALVLNLPFLLAHPAAPLCGGLVRALAVGLVLLVVPGLALAGPFLARRDPSPLSVLWVLSASTAVFAGLVLLARAVGAAPEAGLFWNGAWLATDAALLLQAVRGAPSWRPLLPGRASLLTGLALFAAVYAAYFQGAARVVPPMEDHDYETQGTGYGLLTTLRPALLTDRGTDLYFAHPPLLHLYVAGSFLYWDRLERLEAYESARRRAKAARAGAPPRPAAEEPEVAALYELYRRDPARLPTRTPNLLLSALTVALLGAWAGKASRRPWLGLLAGAAYASSPEVFVRSSYGGYFAVGQLAALFVLLAEAARLGEDGTAQRRDAFLAGVFAALADHKLLFLPFALGAAELLRRRRLHPAAAGFACGTALFWAYGVAVDAGAFWLDHVRTHLLDRALHVNPLGYGGYPGPAALWQELSRHTGWVLLPLGATALAAIASDPHRGEPERRVLRIWGAWMFLQALAFTVVDWRQTKHLMPLLPSLFMAIALWSASSRRGLRTSVLGLLVLTAWNLETVRGLCHDFASFVVTPAW